MTQPLDNIESHPVPPDVIREIFLHAATLRSQALILSLVCKEAYSWIIRLLYRSVTFSTRDDLVKFHETLSIHPELAVFIRSLYIGSIEHEEMSKSGFGRFTWTSDCLTSVMNLLLKSSNIERLALVNLPPSNWSSIEECLPPHLKSLAVGPSYGLLGLSVAHKGLQQFYYADTVLHSTELARITNMPSLTAFRWRSPLRFDEVVYAQLKTLLGSRSLKNLHITLFGTEDDIIEFYKEEYDELISDGRITITCDPSYEGNREWITDFREQWIATDV